MSEPFIGEIIMFAGNFAPTGWEMCNGQLLQISQNAALFSILGATFGGDGRNTFALPDLRGRVPVHQGQAPNLSLYQLGQFGGQESASLTSAQLPVHTHLLAADGNGGGKNTPIGNFLGAVGASAAVKTYSAGPASGNMAATAIATAGGSSPVSSLQPYLAVNFIIAISGMFPTRG
jgi:microcystin-dependent protein